MNQFWDGAELGTTDFFHPTSSRLTVSSAVKRSGLYSYKIDSYKGVGGSDGFARKDITPVAEGFYKLAFYTRVHFVTSPVIIFRNGTTQLVAIGLDGEHFRVLVNGSVVATGSFIYQRNVMYLLKVHVKIADAGIVQLMVDGALDIDYSGDTLIGANTTFDNIYHHAESDDAAQNQSDQAFYIDDLAFNDTTGGVDNSWPLDGRVIYLPTNGAGDATQLTPNTGANYAAVDEVPSDGDTTYVESGTVDQYDLYNLAPSGLVAGSEIKRVVPVATAKDTVANGGMIKLGVKTNGTEYFGDDIQLTTNYVAKYGTEHTVNPQTSAAWTIEELDALQVGPKVRGT